jgi:exopolyphosphatase/guanosine-5'-triphosphate,3'-diphosphate pyrophosphatase
MARDLGAESVYLVATSAVRDSSNREEFAALVHDRTGMGLEILSGDEEARVTCLGALTGLDRSGSVVVCDLGGGSAEVIASVDGSLLWSHSFQMGSGRLTERFVKSDPPASGEVDAVRVAVTAQLSTKPHIHADRAVLTGGTATAMCVLLGTSGETVELRPDNVRNALNLALGGPATQVAARFQLSEERASVLPAGVAALLAVVEHFGADVVVVTRHGIREGYLLDRAGHDSIGPTAVS